MREDQVLREVGPDEAFYFYTDVDQPAGISANSLEALLNKMKSVQIESVEFHTSRGDFEKWIRMLGDETLAEQMAELTQENLMGEPLRERSIRVLQSRYEELMRKPPPRTSSPPKKGGK